MTVDVENYVGGVPVVVLATDGTKLYGLLSDADGHLQVDLLSVSGYAHPDNVLFGYNDRWVEFLDEAAPETGLYEKLTTAVPPNYVYVLQGATFMNTTEARGAISIFLKDGTNEYRMLRTTTPAKNQVIALLHRFVLKAGDQVKFSQSAVTAGDALNLGVWGYKMKV